MTQRNMYGFPIPHPSDIEQIGKLEQQHEPEQQVLHIEDAEPREPMEGELLYNYS